MNFEKNDWLKVFFCSFNFSFSQIYPHITGNKAVNDLSRVMLKTILGSFIGLWGMISEISALVSGGVEGEI